MDVKTHLEKFTDYCWSFYGPSGLHGEFFNHALSRDQCKAACLLRMLTGDNFEDGNAMDRECVREILSFSLDKGLASKSFWAGHPVEPRPDAQQHI